MKLRKNIDDKYKWDIGFGSPDEIEKAFAGSGVNDNDQTLTRIVGFFLTWMQERRSMVKDKFELRFLSKDFIMNIHKKNLKR